MDDDGLSFPPEAAALFDHRLPPSCPNQTKTTSSSHRPFVTLTYASSLDGKISQAPGVRTRLSGAESKAMTHFLRSRHDAILIGVSTLLADDPALNCRLSGTPSQPRPVILDPHLRWTPRPEDKILSRSGGGGGGGVGVAPYIVTGVAADAVPGDSVELLRSRGGRFIHLDPVERSCSDDGRMRFDWSDLLAVLRREGLTSVMVEGGARVIESLLRPDCRSLVDSVIVTIAPTWLGRRALGLLSPVAEEEERGSGSSGSSGSSSSSAVARLREVSWHVFGEDVVLCGVLGGK
ncbi:hypothetical protein XA68_18521 [Ophiocordyceps unilateralis]|uniref:2,5-diamino-6-ribosylamino-4(3H)-pyrimidinone 5'-phosphate reductase n=1 Tax=Ophiocordyceps unilateralis TaxID=268505 RepID=A0A2A9PJF0_OPHUN|nr:hypothetical protein XA68_18521 [Ophiocordyceps unilateralis]